MAERPDWSYRSGRQGIRPRIPLSRATSSSTVSEPRPSSAAATARSAALRAWPAISTGSRRACGANSSDVSRREMSTLLIASPSGGRGRTGFQTRGASLATKRPSCCRPRRCASTPPFATTPAILASSGRLQPSLGFGASSAASSSLRRGREPKIQSLEERGFAPRFRPSDIRNKFVS
jgi:hypothetical protein